MSLTFFAALLAAPTVRSLRKRYEAKEFKLRLTRIKYAFRFEFIPPKGKRVGTPVTLMILKRKEFKEELAMAMVAFFESSSDRMKKNFLLYLNNYANRKAPLGLTLTFNSDGSVEVDGP